MLAQNREWALKMACARLSIGANEFWSSTPLDLAAMFWGARQKLNRHLAILSWQTSWLMAPHVDRKNSSKIAPNSILRKAPYYDPDIEEL